MVAQVMYDIRSWAELSGDLEEKESNRSGYRIPGTDLLIPAQRPGQIAVNFSPVASLISLPVCRLRTRMVLQNMLVCDAKVDHILLFLVMSNKAIFAATS